MSVLVDGQHPIKCASRLVRAGPQQVVRLTTMKLRQLPQSADSDSDSDEEQEQAEPLSRFEEEVAEFSSAADFAHIHNDQPCSLLRAVLFVLGATPGGGDHLPPSCSLEVTCVSTLPGQRAALSYSHFAHCFRCTAGSGMGGSSVLAAAALRSVADLLGLVVGADRLVSLVSQVEQVLTTGGGWQDQVGSIFGGFKIGRCPGHLPVAVSVEALSTSAGFNTAFEQRVFLLYTGQQVHQFRILLSYLQPPNIQSRLADCSAQRLARNTLINALRRCALTPLPDTATGADTVSHLIRGAESGCRLLRDLAERSTAHRGGAAEVSEGSASPDRVRRYIESVLGPDEEEQVHRALGELAAVLNE